MKLGNVESRLAKNAYEVDEGNTHIEVNQEIARATGTGKLLTKIETMGKAYSGRL